MREETPPEKICVYCKRPITREQRPAVLLKNGDEVHVECWNDYEKSQLQKPN